MKHILLFVVGLFLCLGVRAQDDTLWVDQDTVPALPPLRFHLQCISPYWMDGRVQFFDGYNREILYTNASTGLPVYGDWYHFSNFSLIPRYFQVGMNVGFTDSIRGLRLRLGGFYSRKIDTLAYSGGDLKTDTVLGRMGRERASFCGVSISFMKQTRTLLKFLRLYGGADLELGVNIRSQIRLFEYAYDVGEEKYLEYNEFTAKGRPKMNVFLNAIIGFETVFGKRIGFVGEVRSGLGGQMMVKERVFGMARTTYMVGLQYYLWDHQRRPLPVMEHELPEGEAQPILDEPAD